MCRANATQALITALSQATTILYEQARLDANGPIWLAVLPMLLGNQRRDAGNGSIDFVLRRYVMATNLWNVWFLEVRSLRRIETVLFALFLCFVAGAVTPGFAQTFQTSAQHAILIDAATKSVLFEKDADTLVVPASTAKIMTAEIVFHELALGHLHLEDQFVVSESAWRLGGAPARGSAMFAAPNSSIRVEDLIRGLVIV